MIKIHANLLLEFSDKYEVKEVLKVVEGIIDEGVTPWPYPQWLQDWMAAGKFDERQSLMVISTVFPQKALKSIMDYHQVTLDLAKALSFTIRASEPEERDWTELETRQAELAEDIICRIQS